MIGLLNLDKPRLITSRVAVNRVEWLIKPESAGHAGTLDPLATGVLVVAIGRATRLIEYVQRYPKRYLAAYLLGQTSDTEDITGEVTPLVSPPIPSREDLLAALSNFRGEIQQRPPMFSAIRVDGRRAYKRARKGHHVEMTPRPVTIHSLELMEYDYPRFVLDIRCSSGTYVRSIGRDLAESLGTGAVMSELRRTEIGPFHADQSIRVQDLDLPMIERVLQPAAMALCDLPQIQLSGPEWVEIQSGRLIAPRPGLATATEIAALTPAGVLGAILVQRHDALGPVRVFPPEK